MWRTDRRTSYDSIVCVKPWLQSPTGPNSTGWVESVQALWSQLATRLNSTGPVVTSSVILNIWLFVQLSRVEFVVMITAPDPTQLNWTKWPFSRDPVFYFTASGKWIIRIISTYLSVMHCCAMQRCTKLIETHLLTEKLYNANDVRSA